MTSDTPRYQAGACADAVDIDLQCALAMGRAALRALVLVSDDASKTVDQCIGEELDLARMDPAPGSELTACLLQEMRALLRQRRHELERAGFLREQIVVHALSALTICAND